MKTAARLIVDAATSEADVLSGRLWSLGTTGIEEQQGPFLIRLLAGFEDESTAEAARNALGRGTVEAVVHDGWLDTWREFAAVSFAGHRFVLRPIWLDHRAKPNQVVVHLDPGRTFGSGSHPTTQLTLAHLEKLLEGDETVLDVGCGSGVLGIGAARIGATRVDAIDIDPEAIRVTSLNAKRNGVSDIVEVSTDPIEKVTGPYDVVVANILASTIVDLAPYLVRVLGPVGCLVVSGILEEQVDVVLTALAPLVELDRNHQDGWCAVVLGHQR